MMKITQKSCLWWCALLFSGTGNVIKVQELLHICSEHYETKDQENNEKTDDKNKNKKKEETKEESPDLSLKQGRKKRLMDTLIKYFYHMNMEYSFIS